MENVPLALQAFDEQTIIQTNHSQAILNGVLRLVNQHPITVPEIRLLTGAIDQHGAEGIDRPELCAQPIFCKMEWANLQCLSIYNNAIPSRSYGCQTWYRNYAWRWTGNILRNTIQYFRYSSANNFAYCGKAFVFWP